MQPRQGYFQLQQCHSIPSPLSQLLSYGLDFGLPVYKINFFKYFLSFEKLAICLKPFFGNNFPQFCSDMKAVAHKFYYGFKPHKVFSAVVNKEDQRVLKELASDKDIVVSRPDKGRGVVIVNKADYVSSMTKMIEGNTKFSKVNEPINKVLLSIDSKINCFLEKLKKNKAITLNCIRTCMYLDPALVYYMASQRFIKMIFPANFNSVQFLPLITVPHIIFPSS